MATQTCGQQQDSNDIYKKLVEELLKNQSVVNLAASLNSDSVNQRRGKPIIGRNGQDSSAPVPDSTAVTSSISLETLIQSLAAQVQSNPRLSESSTESTSSSVSTMMDKPTLDRSQSINIPQTTNNVMGFKGMNMDRYKTELCRQFQETGFCKYGAKCQFAHGTNEVRTVSRHPKYKSDLCRTYHTTGLCPYGTRCHFVHDEEVKMQEACRRQKAALSQMARHPNVQRHSSLPVSSCRPDSRMFNPAVGSSYLDVSMSMGSVGDTPPSSISSSPAPSPTAFLFEDRTQSLPTPSPDSAFIAPPPGFSGPLTAPISRSQPTIFNFPDVAASKVELPTMNNPVASLAAGLQAAIPTHDENLVKDCFSDFYYMPPSPPMGADNEAELCESPMDISRNLRLPIFGQLSSLE